MDPLKRGHSAPQEDHSCPATARPLLVRFRRLNVKVLVRVCLCSYRKDVFTSLRLLTVDGDNNDHYVFALATDLLRIWN